MIEQENAEQTTLQSWRRALKRLLFMTATVLLLGLPIVMALYWVTSIGLRPIDQISVNAGQSTHIREQQLKQLIIPQAQQGFFGLDVDELRQTLQQIPWVESAGVRRIWPDRLEIELLERQPLTRWGSQQLLDAHGRRFLPPPQSIPDNLPWLDGPADSEQRVLEQYLQFAELLKVTGLGIYAVSVNQRGAWRLKLDNGLELLLGRERMTQRLWRLVQVYSTVIKPKQADIRNIDLRYSNGFALSWRKPDDNPTKPN